MTSAMLPPLFNLGLILTQCKLAKRVSTSCGSVEFPARFLTIIQILDHNTTVLLDIYDVSDVTTTVQSRAHSKFVALVDIYDVSDVTTTVQSRAHSKFVANSHSKSVANR